MVLHGLLPKPLSAEDVVVGQLLAHPLHPERDGFLSAQAEAEIDELSNINIQPRYKDLFSVDNEGRFMTNYGAKFDLGRVYRQTNLLKVTAEQMIQRTSQSPIRMFEAVCSDPDARTWIYNVAKTGQGFYIVLGVTELHRAKFLRARLQDAGASSRLAETPIEQDARVPRSLARSNPTLAGLSNGEASISGVFGMDVRHCTVRITTPQEPHKLDDIAYRWSYFDVPGSKTKEQLMIGLGDPIKADVLRSMLDLTVEDVQTNLDAISRLSMGALSAAASPMLKPSSPALRGRSPSPHPLLKARA